MIRDKIRGVNPDILYEVNRGFRKPDIIFYCVAPIEIAFSRLIHGKGLSYYGSGSDLNLAHGREENCLKYEKMMDTGYGKIFKDMPHCYEIDMNKTPEKIFKEIKGIIADEFSIGKYKQE
jgi:thymidylate kinase